MIIKVCGMRDPENISELMELEINYMGFIFYPHSPRFVGSNIPEITKHIPTRIKKTGVFVNEEIARLIETVHQNDLQAVQLHGDETVEYCKIIKNQLDNLNTGSKIEIIKAFGIHPGFEFGAISEYQAFVDHFLFDTRSQGFGGTGSKFDWELLKNYKGQKTFFLSGGLDSAQASELRKITHPLLAGFDLNSRFEVSPGLKDVGLLRNFLNNFKNITGSSTL